MSRPTGLRVGYCVQVPSLLGIHSVECPPAWREQIWAAMAGADKPSHLDSIATQTVGLRDVFDVCEAIMAGRNTGRTVVDIQA